MEANMREQEFEIQRYGERYAIAAIALRDGQTSLDESTTLGTVMEVFDTLEEAEGRLRELQDQMT